MDNPLQFTAYKTVQCFEKIVLSIKRKSQKGQGSAYFELQPNSFILEPF